MRTRVRAIITKGNKILLIKRVKKDLTYLVFPGGGVRDNENIKNALIRECKEELGVSVEVMDLFLKNRFDFPNQPQIEEFYFCKTTSGKLGTGDGPEYQENSDYEGTHEIVWVDVNQLKDIDLRPERVKNKLYQYFLKEKIC